MVAFLLFLRQMPLIGLTSFLQIERAIRRNRKNLCQCPQSGFLHFYHLNPLTFEKNEKMCQCPQSGFLHFYILKTKSKQRSSIVSMPSVGLSSFLPRRQQRSRRQQGCVNALSRAFFISTDECARGSKAEKKGVNALSRAFFISTVRQPLIISPRW